MRTALKSTRAQNGVRSVKDLDLVTKEKTMKLARFIKDATYSAVAMTLCVAMIAAPIATQAQQQQQDPNMQGPPPQDAQQQGPPPSFSPAQLDQITGRIALYPDSLLAQVLTASTYSDQIPDAAKYADEHHYLTGQALANAIQQDQLPFDPSVQALIPFPSVLDTMASDMGWTTDLGNAVLADQNAVMDAVQRDRQKAYNYGYLRTNQQIVVTPGPYVTIAPVDPGYIVVPAYNPVVVYAAPRPGFFIGGAIGFGFGVGIGGFFRPWGWGYTRFGWGTHEMFVNNVAWHRTWVNRGVYVHPYPGVAYHRPGPGPYNHAAVHYDEHHEAVARSQAERQAAHEGHAVHEEHHDDHHHH
jgi:hypothetical protein